MGRATAQGYDRITAILFKYFESRFYIDILRVWFHTIKYDTLYLCIRKNLLNLFCHPIFR